MSAILFGSISSLADTSEIQREAFNAAFAEHGLVWRWDRDDYRSQLRSNGGADRLPQFAPAPLAGGGPPARRTPKLRRFPARVRHGAPAPARRHKNNRRARS